MYMYYVFVELVMIMAIQYREREEKKTEHKFNKNRKKMCRTNKAVGAAEYSDCVSVNEYPEMTLNNMTMRQK